MELSTVDDSWLSDQLTNDELWDTYIQPSTE